jgi:hypothetical protein
MAGYISPKRQAYDSFLERDSEVSGLRDKAFSLAMYEREIEELGLLEHKEEFRPTFLDHYCKRLGISINYTPQDLDGNLPVVMDKLEGALRMKLLGMRGINLNVLYINKLRKPPGISE